MAHRGLKIALVFEIFHPVVNGIITSGQNLAENLRALGHEVIFLVPDTGEFREPTLGGVAVYRIPSLPCRSYPGMRYVLPWNRAVGEILTREGVQVLHITGPWFLTMAAVRAARNRGIPVVHTFHTMVHEADYLLYMVRFRRLVPLVRRLGWRFYGWYIARCAAHTAPSALACRVLTRQFPCSRPRQISNGVDTALFRREAPSLEELRRRYPWFTDRTVLFVGRLGREKSLDVLIRAAAILRGRPGLERFRLALVGDGPSRDSYRGLVRSLNLEGCVHFPGYLPHGDLLASGLLHRARVFATASTTENQPMTVIEAICCGVPVVVPDVAGIRELVGENGLGVAPGDPRAFAEALEALCTGDDLHRGASRAALAMARRFDGAAVARQMLDLYQEVLRRESGRAPKRCRAPRGRLALGGRLALRGRLAPERSGRYTFRYDEKNDDKSDDRSCNF
ncbi:phosphatidylinositol alpha 1,6-mannosyltransferase [Alkalispirochaeta americana]|uniref:Phosphatidylinositol alpha 1,6-mannosyltransferase n=1 Tax=Alkalispirochaeta americana TaxID=159291 RepID=A0A1N6XGC2_9SPIO|nr:glycosyltransferase [Alkalispirochaeta americana]SIR01327.1 phosphatidylinositol alpha 1,6-mannosyltransferase [Alkalispirochaeta americana]